MSKTTTAKAVEETSTVANSPANIDLIAFGLNSAQEALTSMLALVRAAVPGIGQAHHYNTALQRQLDNVAFAAAAFKQRVDVRAELERAATTWVNRGKRPDFS